MEMTWPSSASRAARRTRPGARRPVRSVRWLVVQRHIHHPLYPSLRDGGRATRPRCILFQSRDAACEKAVPPARRLLRRHVHPPGNLLVLQSFCGQQHDPRPLHNPRGQRTSARHSLQGVSLFRDQVNCGSDAHTISSSIVWTHSGDTRYYLRRTTLGKMTCTLNPVSRSKKTMPIASDVIVGKNVTIFHPDLVNLYGCRIGDGSKIGAFVEIQRGAAIGENCKVSSHTFVCSGVTLEDAVFVGHGVMFINDRYPRAVNVDGWL